MPFDGIFLYAALSEIKEKLVGGKVEKIYQPEKEEVALVIRKERLLINLSQEAARICISYAKKENPDVPPNFCMLLRKQLTGAKLIEVTQPQNDRIATLVFEAYNEMGDTVQRLLQIEIMGRCSNLILIENGRIIDAVKRVDFSQSTVRQILPGMVFEPLTPQDKKPIYEVDIDDFVREIKESDAPVHRLLMNKISGLSPLWSRELCFRAGDIAEKEGREIDGDKLKAVLCDFAATVWNCAFTPVLINGEKPDYSFDKVTQYGDCITEYESIGALTDSFYQNRNTSVYVKQRGSDLQKLVNSHIERLSRKLNMLKEELSENQNKEIYKIYGELITAEIYKIKKGDTALKAFNYYTGEDLEIPLDVMLTPAENAQHYFKIYRKSRTALVHNAEETKKAAMDLEYMHSVADALTRSTTTPQLQEIREELERGGFAKSGRVKQRQQKRKYRRFLSADGFEILAGCNNLQNEELTFRVASRQDIWLHTLEVPGSHVIIRGEGRDIPDKTVEQAAIIAATLSSAQVGAKIPVDFTKICYVKKIPSSRPGFVSYTNQTTLMITPDAELIKALEK